MGSQTSVNVSPNTEQFYYLGFEYAGCPFRDSTLLQPLSVDVNLVEPPFACYNEEVVISANATPTSVVLTKEKAV